MKRARSILEHDGVLMTPSSVGQIHMLVLGHPDIGEEFSGWIESHGRVDYVESFESALEALRGHSYDVIVSQAADFIPFQDVHFSRQAAAILDSASQGVGIVGQSGELVWANPKLLSFPEPVRKRVSECAQETFEWAQRETQSGTSQLRGRRFSFTTKNDELYELTATPVIDLHHRVTQVATVVWDATGARRLQDKMSAIDRAGRELLSLDGQQLTHLTAQDRLSLIEQKILRCIRELLHFENFEIRVLDKESNRLELALAHGLPSDAIDMEVHATSEGNGVRGYVAATGRSYICPDASADSRFVPCTHDAKSSLTVPLLMHDDVVGVANFESAKLAAFNEDDRQFAEIFVRYIVLSLHILELLVTERHTTTGQVASDVLGEISVPVNDILTDVENLVEDYIGHDDLRHRLRSLSANVVKIRDSIKSFSSARPGLLGLRTTANDRKDPLLMGKRVLIADDEDLIRDTVRDVLRGHGCEVHAATDGAFAIELLAEYSFDLVLSDIRMPKKNGYEVFAAAKQANALTPVILTTGFGYDPNHSIIRARREGLAAVLFKPFKVDQLLEEIRMALQPNP